MTVRMADGTRLLRVLWAGVILDADGNNPCSGWFEVVLTTMAG